jgi:hypothetical protein
VTALVYTGTAKDLEILIEANVFEGRPEELAAFNVISDEEMREAMAREWAYLVRHKSYGAFWRGYRVATADAAAALKPFEPKPSLLTRLVRWLS